MKNRILAAFALLSCATVAFATGPAPIATLRAIHALSNAEASHALPVEFEATVIYYRSYERTLFVQDGDAAIYVQAINGPPLAVGDRVLVKGTTQPSFRPFVMSSDIRFLRHGELPKPEPATFDELIRAKLDCRYVAVRARVRTADLVLSNGVISTRLQMMAEGGEIEATVENDNSAALNGLLDTEVEVTGASSGRFDGKMQQTGILIHVPSMSQVKVMGHGAASPWQLPVTAMDQILSGYHVVDQTRRVQVRGSITYFQPGSAVVLQDGAQSLWIKTETQAPLHIGDRADASGFPATHDGFLTLTGAEIHDRQEFEPVVPRHEEWSLLSSGKHSFDLVSIDAIVVAAVRRRLQDEYVVAADGELFSAIYRHPIAPAVTPAMKQIPLGSKVRITGICMLTNANPFEGQVPFEILMRSFDDIAVVARPSMLNVRNLIFAVSGLILLVLAVSTWGWTMKSKVRTQTAALAVRIEAEAALERRMAKLEQGRSRILEDINGTRPLAEIIEQVTELATFRLQGAPCWCEIAGGARLGTYPQDPSQVRIAQLEIPGRAGQMLGRLYAGFDAASQPGADEEATLSAGAKLAALAIETRKLYADLRHRSEFDQLTDIHNRFSIEKYMISLIEESRETAGIFGLIYVDLDHFKQVNDFYGHRVGDLYLQQAADRMKRQLRSGDMLARLGGDEFAILLPMVGSRAHIEEVALRLERCFDEPFQVNGHTLRGSASVGTALYPEDGTSKDSLLSAADAAMYVTKHTRQQVADRVDAQSKPDSAPDVAHNRRR